MTKTILDAGLPPSVFNYHNVFPTELPVEKTVRAHSGPIMAISTEQPQMALNLEVLGQGMLDVLALMQADGYEPEPVNVTDEMLARMLAFSIVD